MTKKGFLASVASILITVSSFAQSSAESDTRLLSRFSEAELNNMSQSELAYWNYYVANSFEVIQLPQEKTDNLSNMESVSIPETGTINIFELDIEPHAVGTQYFRINNTDQVLKVLSSSTINANAPSVTAGSVANAAIPSSQPMGGGAQTIAITDVGPVTISCGEGASNEHTLNDDDTGADYPPNANYSVTVCPDGLNGSKVTLDIDTAFHVWDIADSDFLNIYDGEDTSAPLLGSFNTSTDTAGFAIEATLDNASGCLTIEFVSDGSVEGAGFSGFMACYYPCQTFVPHINTIPELIPGDTGYVDICLGDTVNFSATADYPYSGLAGGIGYVQWDPNSTFNWIISDGTEINDMQSFDFVPTQRAGYFVDLQIVDTLGCVEIIRSHVRVSTIPSFTELATVLDDTICPGESSIILGGFDANGQAIGHNPVQGSFISGGIFGAETFLPDGSNDNYTTDIEITQFEENQTIQNASDIIDVCLTMEHSYLGDLEMTLTCPDGTTIDMFNSYNGPAANQLSPGGFGGGGIFLGDALDDGSTNPGVGWEYCFSDDSFWGTMGQEFAAGNFTIAPTENSNSMSPGTYQPEESYDNLIGCPINGTWTITVRDNLNIDNGYIFEWGILFDPDINPNSEFYTPEIIDGYWSVNPLISEFLADSAIMVEPPAPGDYDFTFNVEDDYGCLYDTTVWVHMVPPVTSFTDTSVCSDQIPISAAEIPVLGEWSVNTIAGTASFSPDEFSSDANVQVSDYGRYTFVFEADYCGQVDSIEVQFNPTPSSVAIADQTVCPGTDLTFDAENEGIGAVYLWQPTGETTQEITIENIQSTTGIQVTINNDCGTANGAATITVESLDVSGPSDVCLEDVASLTADVSTSGGTWTYTSPVGADATFSPSETDETPDITASAEGAYRFVFTDNDCGMMDSVDVFFTPAPTIEVVLDTNRVCVEDMAVLSFTSNTQLYDSFSWEPFGLSSDTIMILGTDSLAFNPIDTSFYVTAIIENFCGTDSEEISYKVIDCNLDVPNVFNPESSIPENQYFNIVALDLHPGNNVKIFDRWGRKCYDVDDYHLNPWNGGKEADGVYYYTLVRPGYEAETGYVHLVRGSQ